MRPFDCQSPPGTIVFEASWLFGSLWAHRDMERASHRVHRDPKPAAQGGAWLGEGGKGEGNGRVLLALAALESPGRGWWGAVAAGAVGVFHGWCVPWCVPCVCDTHGDEQSVMWQPSSGAQVLELWWRAVSCAGCSSSPLWQPGQGGQGWAAGEGLCWLCSRAVLCIVLWFVCKCRAAPLYTQQLWIQTSVCQGAAMEPWGKAQTTQVPHCGGCSFQLKTFQL